MIRTVINRLRAAALAVVGLAVLAGCTQFTGAPKSVAPALVEQAQFTLNRFRDNEDLRKIDVHIPDAAGIMILPSVVKGGFIGAAEAGSGVLLARRPDGSWSYPAFYLLGGGSVGLQLGLQETEIVMIIRNRGALEAVIRNQGKVGADIGVTVGIRGIGYEGSTTTNLGADILAFTRGSLGAFGGASLEGAALVRRNDLNEAFYEPGAEPRAIVIDGKYRNPAADMLRNAIEPK